MNVDGSELPAGFVLRLKVQCGGCYHFMGSLLEDQNGDLWLRTDGRLNDDRGVPPPDRGPIPKSKPGEWFADPQIEQVPDENQFLHCDCTKNSSPNCGDFYSWTLRQARSELAEARATGKALTFRL